MNERVTVEQTVIWEPQPGPQDWLLRCPVFEIFFGGARGGGKSDGMLGDFAIHADEFGQDAIGLIIRRERTQLRELIERSHQIYTVLGATFSAQDKMWRFPGGARLTFAYLESDSDAEAYQGHSYSRVYVEEIGNFPRSDPIFKLMATIRSANPKVVVGFRASGNPGGPGHLWVKRRYIDPAPRGMKIVKSKFVNPFTKEETTLDRVFIPSKITDNKFNNNSAYIARVQMSGGPKLVKAWLEGNWDYIEGAFFTEWNPNLHVIPQFMIPPHWTRFVSMDWGSAHPFSVGWWAIVPERFEAELIAIGDIGQHNARFQYQNNLPRGALVRYREWYGCQVDAQGESMHNDVGLKLDIDELAKGISARETFERKRGARYAYRTAGKDLFKHEGGPSLAERMMPFGQMWQPADNARVSKKGAIGGWDMVRFRLIGADGMPMMYFFDNCVDAIRTLPAMQHDPDNLEDVQSEAEDHCFAAGTMVETDIGPQPIEALSSGRVHSVDEVLPYRNGRLTRRQAKVVKLCFDDGHEIVCTPDHRFLVDFDEWRYAQNLNGESVLCSRSLFQGQSRNSMESGTTFAENISSERGAGFISWCGSTITDQFRKVIMFIMRLILPGTALAISNVSLFSLTSAASTGRRLPKTHVSLFPSLGSPLPRGMVARKESSGIPSITRSILEIAWKGLSKLCASIVAASSWPRKFTRIEPSSVAPIARRVRCVSVEDLPDRRDVYCITVPSNATFAIEGGILVANCPDEIRYACMSRPYTRLMETKGPDRIFSIGHSNNMVINDVLDEWNEPRPKRVPRFERIA